MSRIWVDFNPSPSALYARLRLDTPRSTRDLHRLPSLHEGMSLKIYDDENEADAVLRLRDGVWVAENLTNHRTVWRTTVTDVVGVFRDALIALIPSLERARIPWRDGEASDDFDALAKAAYATYVLSAFRFGLTTDEEAIHVPPWDLYVTTYAESDWIEVISNDTAERPLALVGFKTRDTPFDTVTAQPLTAAGECQGDPVHVSFEYARFRFQWRQDPFTWTSVEHLHVQL
jgi:hypothetical protein